MDRTKSLGGSDIPAVAELDPYRKPIDVFLEKRGEAPPREETWPMRLGTEQEALVANWYAKETGFAIQPSKQIIHPQFAWISGTPDRIILQKKKVTRGLECKFRSERMREKYGDPGTDEVLPSDMAQCCWYMLLFPVAEAWDVAVQFGNQERQIFTVQRDNELIEMFFNVGKEFWEQHIIPGIPPPIDGSKSATEYLKRKYPQDAGPMLDIIDPAILADIDRYREVRKALKRLEILDAMYENRLKEITQDAQGLRGEFGKILWKKNRDSIMVDTKTMIAENPELAEKYKVTKPGARVWRPYFTKEND